MTFFAKVRRAIFDDSGAVTVDWVVLTAAVVILSIGAIAALDSGVDSMITAVSSQLSTGTTEVGNASWGDASVD